MPAFKKKYVYAGRYQLEDLIGTGGFSEVWRAKDAMTDDATVALKIYAPEKGLDEFGIRQFRKEYAIAFDLSHPHLMKVLHFDICHGSPYLIMPYLAHGSISRYVQANAALSEKQVACVMHQIGGALTELHSQEPPILHQDIKPDNILVRKPEYFVLSDFGISHKTRHTLTKATGGLNSLTIAYSPPERFDKNPQSTEASDIFSFGVSLYEMCAGTVPWDGHGGQSLYKGARIPDLPAPFPRELNRILQRCMAINPTERPTAEQLSNIGKHFLDKGFWRLEEPSKGRSRGKIAVVVAAILITTLAGLGFFYKDVFVKADRSIKSNPSDSVQRQATIVPVPEKKKAIVDSLANKKPGVQVQNVPKNDVKQDVKKLDSSPAPQPDPVPPAKPKRYSKDSIEYYLQALSDQTRPIADRMEIKRNVLKLFSAKGSKIIERSGSSRVTHNPAVYMDQLMNSSYKIKLVDLSEDINSRIETLTIDVHEKQL